MVRLTLFLTLCMVLAGIRPTQAAATDSRTPTELVGRAWLYGEVPAWDIANEGLPFRMTLALPSAWRDPVGRILLTSEARWTVNLGYAKVYNSYDAATGIFKNPGGHAALFGLARQYRWQASRAPAFVPKLVIDFGVNFASRPFPADGTRATLQLVTGLEWTWRGRKGEEWTAGLIWPHFSNANLFSRNAGYDGLALRVGRSIRF